MQKKTAASARGMNKNAPKETFVSVDGSTERKLVASQPRKMEVVWDLTEVADEEMVRTDTVKNKRQMKKLRNKKKREEAAAARMQTTEESEVDKQMTKAGGIKKDSEKQVHPKPKKMFAHKAVQTVVVPAGTLVKMMVSKSVQTEESVVESKSTKTRKTTDEEEEKEEKIPIDTTQQNVKPKKMTSAEALGLMSEGLEDEEMAQTESDVVEDNGEGNRNKRKKLDEEEELGEETSNKGKGFAFFERNGKGEEIKKEDMAKFDRIYKESEEDRQAREERWNEEHAIVLRENLVRGKKDIEELSDDDIFYIDGDAHQGLQSLWCLWGSNLTCW